MKIGGIQTFSLNDFPGHVAAVVFTQGCNFRCPFCHNGGLMPIAAPLVEAPSESDVLAFLKRRRRQLDGVVISGGEPTLHNDLADFIRVVRSLGYAVKLDTNGSRPRLLAALIADQLLDFIAMDVKAPLDNYDHLTGVHVNTADIRQSIEIIANSSLNHQFRTTVVPGLHAENDITRIRRLLPDPQKLKLQTFVPENAFDPELRVSAAAAAPIALAG